VIAASREDLEAMVRRGAFRRELYLRLRVVTLFIPPLRSRVADIIRVAERLVVSLARLHELPAPEISPEVRRALEEHSWPGNVRELKHALERALLLSTSGQLNVAELFPHVSTRITPAGGIPFPAELDHITNAAACAMMEMCGGNLSEAARRLNISRSRLRRLLKATPTGEFARAAS
jgi:DNA-binding NtrC family response regulator